MTREIAVPASVAGLIARYGTARHNAALANSPRQLVNDNASAAALCAALVAAIAEAIEQAKRESQQSGREQERDDREFARNYIYDIAPAVKP